MLLKNKLYLFLIILSMPFFMFGQEEETTSVWKKEYKHSLGFAAGLTTGYGLAYRYMPSRIGIMGVFAPFKNDYRTEVNVGATLTYDVAAFDNLHFFLYQANSFYYYQEETYYWDPFYTQEPMKEEGTYFNHGIGFGGEGTFVDRIGLNVMVGYASRENFERLGLTIEGGLFLKF